MIVIDASVMLHILLDASLEQNVLGKTQEAGDLIAPHILDVEVLHAIRRHLMLKRIDSQRAETAVTDFQSFTIDRQPVHSMNWRIWELRNNLTPYDAAYISLAELFEIPLFTRDTKIAGAAGHRAKIVLL